MTDVGKDLEGPIVLSSRGVGYFNVDDKTSYEIPAEKTKRAFHGDIVKIRPTGEVKDEKPQAEVIELVKRTKTTFVGTVQKNGTACMLKPDSRKMNIDFLLALEECEKVNDKDKVMIEMIDWPESSTNPKGKVLKIFGKKGDHEAEMQSIIFDKGFDTGFSPEIEREAQELKKIWSPIPAEEIAKRKDFRETTTFTIDPLTAKDFDDALSVKKLENGNYEIGVHIADVSHFVQPGTALDEEAADRSFSVYMVDRTVPMLPEILSNDLCSLNPNEEKLAFSTVFEMNPEGEVISDWYGKTIIKSDKRFTYEDAQETLDAKAGPLIDELLVLQTISRKLRDRKLKDGAIRFEKDEFAFELDKNGVPLRIYKKEHIETHGLIEEFMLLSNRRVAKYIYDYDKKHNGGVVNGLMYRVHDVPDKDKIEDLRVFLKALGYNLIISKDGSISSQHINELLDAVKNKPEESMVSTATIRTMSKALYSTANSGHFGLAFEYYTHFTSPIRRYPDLVVHRILETFLKGEKISPRDLQKLTGIASHASTQEVAAAEAERNSIKYKQIEFMKNHVGETFSGIISGLAKWGAYVTLDDTGAEGLVHVTKMGKDFYNYDQKNYRIVGERTGEIFRLGDQVKVKIEAADMDEQKLDMSFVKEK